MSVLSHELLQKGFEVQPVRDLSLSNQHPKDKGEMEVMHKRVQVNEVFVASTLSGEQCVCLLRRWW